MWHTFNFSFSPLLNHFFPPSFGLSPQDLHTKEHNPGIVPEYILYIYISLYSFYHFWAEGPPNRKGTYSIYLYTYLLIHTGERGTLCKKSSLQLNKHKISAQGNFLDKYCFYEFILIKITFYYSWQASEKPQFV